MRFTNNLKRFSIYNLLLLASTGEAQLPRTKPKARKTPFIRKVGPGKKESRHKMKDNQGVYQFRNKS